MTRFADKVALVTGAASGIGAAVAEALAAEGASVAAFDRDVAGARATVDRIEATGGRALALAGDVRDESAVSDAISQSVTAYGGLDLLVPIAGVLHVCATVDESVEQWRRTLETNVMGPFLFVRGAIPELRRRGGGAVVLASSVMAFASVAGTAAYSASKGAVCSLVNALALELVSYGIRVNGIVPGTIRTPMLRGAVAAGAPENPDAAMEALGPHQPLGRLIEPAEVARLVLFLLSPEASAMTGACYRVDGALLSALPA